MGTAVLAQVICCKKSVIQLKDVRYAPGLGRKQKSPMLSRRKRVSFVFTGVDDRLMEEATYNGKTIMKGGHYSNVIYEMKGPQPERAYPGNDAYFNAVKKGVIHKRAPHASVKTLQKMEEFDPERGLDSLKADKDASQICESCIEGKSGRAACVMGEMSVTQRFCPT